VDQLRLDPARARARAQGFTLVELMIAMAILAVGLLALGAMQLQALRFGSSGKHVSQAALIARDKMEEFQRMPWAGVAVTTWTTPATVDAEVETSGGTVTEQAYGLSWRVSDLLANRTRAIDVQVTWDEPGRPGRSYTLSSVRHNGGV
jgi:prepilin-type N-terminal cleavage/methylation domain-containing protein